MARTPSQKSPSTGAQKQNAKMKKLHAAILVISLTAAMSASATTTVYSDTDFSSMASYNGTYVAGSPGYEALSYVSTDDPNDAVVGVRGPLGTLNSLSMSFEYSNPVGAGNAPFAAFGVSVDGNWGATSVYEYDIISEQGNQLSGGTLVHVWDWNLNGGLGGDVAGLTGVTLDYVLSQADSYNGVAFGDLEVMRAYAYIGDTGGPSSGSVDIDSITITSVPEPTTMLAGTLLLLPFGASTLRILRKSRAA